MNINREILKTVGAITALLALFTAGVLVPYGIRDAGLQKRIDKARELLGIGEVDHAGLVRLYAEVKDLEQQLSERQHIPQEDEVSTVLQDLTGLINAPGVSGQEIVTLKKEYYADYNLLPVKLQFEAPFATAFDLIRRVETLPSVVRIESVDVEAPKDYPGQPLTVNMDLSVIFAAQPEEGVEP